MANDLSRRDVLRAFTVPLVASATPVVTGVASRFSRAVDAAPSMRFGYAAITWGGAVTQAIDDIAAVGFRGIQLRLEAFAQFGDRPAALRELLSRRSLTMAALSSGNLSNDPAQEALELATHVALVSSLGYRGFKNRVARSLQASGRERGESDARLKPSRDTVVRSAVKPRATPPDVARAPRQKWAPDPLFTIAPAAASARADGRAQASRGRSCPR
jgi:hypothetical protein